MAVERRNPLPVGRYWVDQFETVGPGAGILGFDMWLRRHDNEVRLLKREDFPAGFWGGPKHRVWYLFQVEQPVPWERGWGFPTIVQSPAAPTAPPVTSSADTAQTPPPEPGPMQQLEDLFGDAKTVLVVGVLIWAFSNMGTSRGR
jgi:hypothetical protein